MIEIKDKVIHASHSIAVSHGQLWCFNCAAVASHNDDGHGGGYGHPEWHDCAASATAWTTTKGGPGLARRNGTA
eukprot:6567624-Pyramimonas_sp.AAC.1